LAIFAFAAFTGCTSQSANSPPAPEQPKVDASLTVKQLLDEFQADSQAAKAKYDGKTIAVFGAVKSKEVSLTGNGGHLTLIDADDAANPILTLGLRDVWGVEVSGKPSGDEKTYNRLLPGQKLEARGKFGFYGNAPVLWNPTILKTY